MSTRASKRPLISYARDPQRKRVALKVNLNEVPPCENRPLETTSTRGNLRAAQASGQGVLLPSISGRLPNAPIIVEELAEEVDDEVTISSPRSFAEARNNLSRRRNHHQNLNQMVTVLVEDDNDVHQGLSGATEEEPDTRLTLNGYGNRGRAVSNHPPVVNLEKDVVTIPEPSPKPKQMVVAKEPVFSCAICISPLVEEHSTICGHIFCKKCIKEAIAAQKKCPTCRRHLRVNNIHRVYLPTTS